MDYKNTRFTITLSNRSDRLYAVTMTNEANILLNNDDKMDAKILDLLQGALGYFEEQGAAGKELYQLISTNIILSFNVEDMIPHDDTLKEIVDKFGLKIVYPKGI